jgi:hypothetical protein
MAEALLPDFIADLLKGAGAGVAATFATLWWLERKERKDSQDYSQKRDIIQSDELKKVVVESTIAIQRTTSAIERLSDLLRIAKRE